MAGIKAKMVEIDEQRAGQRIDNYLLSYFSKIPKSRIYRALRSGEVRVNKKRVKPLYRLQTGDTVRIPPIREVSAAPTEEVPANKCELLETQILFEDEHLMAINKPSGMAAHSGTGDAHGVIEIIRASRIHQPFLELAHRIDKETSGCLVLAKSRKVLLDIQQCLQDSVSRKQYTCLVKGRWQVDKHEVVHSLKKSSRNSQGAKMAVDEAGLQARTTFSTISLMPGASLMQAQIHSGRTHQIRVHAQEEQHPIAGDKRYGDFAYNRELQKLGLRRMFLHASYLRLQLAGLSQTYEFNAPLPRELKEVCKRLKNDSLE